MTEPARPRKVMIGGEWKWPHYEAAYASGFQELGWEVIRFKQPASEDGLGVIGRKLRLSAMLGEVNSRFLRAVGEFEPDIVFLERCDLVLPESVARVRSISPATCVFLYHNDDPYRGTKDGFRLRHFLGSIAHADATFVFRPVNVEEARRLGAPVVETLLPYYVRSLHFPVSDRKIEYDVVFVGTVLGGGRAEAIEALAEAGLRVGLFGTGWDKVPRSCTWIRSQNVVPVRGDDYRRALSSGLMALVFLSKLNRDVWTTRCFEIPACGVSMLAPDNEHLRGIFGEEEAMYFHEGDDSDLVEQALRWSREPERCLKVGEAGLRRCIEDGHSEVDRARQIVRLWEKLSGG